MRGIYNSVTDIRRKVFAAIARMAYEDETDYAKRIEEIPYEILPGTKAKYRNSIFLNGRSSASACVWAWVCLFVK